MEGRARLCCVRAPKSRPGGGAGRFSHRFHSLRDGGSRGPAPVLPRLRKRSEWNQAMAVIGLVDAALNDPDLIGVAAEELCSLRLCRGSKTVEHVEQVRSENGRFAHAAGVALAIFSLPGALAEG